MNDNNIINITYLVIEVRYCTNVLMKRCKIGILMLSTESPREQITNGFLLGKGRLAIVALSIVCNYRKIPTKLSKTVFRKVYSRDIFTKSLHLHVYNLPARIAASFMRVELGNLFVNYARNGVFELWEHFAFASWADNTTQDLMELNSVQRQLALLMGKWDRDNFSFFFFFFFECNSTYKLFRKQHSQYFFFHSSWTLLNDEYYNNHNIINFHPWSSILSSERSYSCYEKLLLWEISPKSRADRRKRRMYNVSCYGFGFVRIRAIIAERKADYLPIHKRRHRPC